MEVTSGPKGFQSRADRLNDSGPGLPKDYHLRTRHFPSETPPNGLPKPRMSLSSVANGQEHDEFGDKFGLQMSFRFIKKAALSFFNSTMKQPQT